MTVPAAPTEPRADFFLVGCQKSATTWIHRCLREHPQIYVPEADELHFFDINYHRGFDWYRRFFQASERGLRIGDTTSSYVRAPEVPGRIHEYNPEARIIVSLRNPIDRAFSHYWHEKKKQKIAFRFEELFENYDLFESWIATGFYFQHLKRFYEYFPEHRVLVLVFEDIQANPEAFIRRVFEFLDVDASFEPQVLHSRVNVAGRNFEGAAKLKQRTRGYALRVWKALPERTRTFLKSRGLGSGSMPRVETEYEKGLDAEIRAQLREIYEPYNALLAEHLGRDLSMWT